MQIPVDEETPLLAKNTKKQPTPLPWFQFSILLVLQLAEPLTSNVIYPFTPQVYIVAACDTSSVRGLKFGLAACARPGNNSRSGKPSWILCRFTGAFDVHLKLLLLHLTLHNGVAIAFFCGRSVYCPLLESYL